ncbi:hypothetical protein CK203_041258 [Vitis vinifera]|uniref:Uncharacterized protein n=1 Tax=Vitis vinifera TaxID=29760 RepID=A0A438HJ42_VITVI|nr:hypothetical protein CK203_041258 [Vitis vinifera]
MIVGSDLLSLHPVLSPCRWRNVGHDRLLWKIRMRVTRMTVSAMCHREMHVTCHYKMRAMCSRRKGFFIQLWAKKCLQRRKTVSSTRVGDAREKTTDKLDVKEFQDRFCIPNGVIVELLNDEEVLVPTEKVEKDTIIFFKGTIQRGAPFPLPALFKEFLHFTQIPPPSFIPTSSGC